MSQITAIFGTDDDKEILNSLHMIASVSTLILFAIARLTHAMQNTAGLGLIHESINIHNTSSYT
jgi:hypothetical protein